MVCLTVLYPGTPEAAFDMDYYLNSHIPMAGEKLTPLGLNRVEVLRGAGTLDGSPVPYAVICNLYFANLEALQTALFAAGAAVSADIPNYCKVTPVFQISEVEP